MRGALSKEWAAAGLSALLALWTAGAQAAPRRPAPKRKPAAHAAQKVHSPVLQAGLEALERGDYAAAIGEFGRAARAGEGAAAYFLLGYAHYQRGFVSGDPDAADKQDALETVNAYTTALALDPRLSSVAQPYKLYHSLGLSYEALGSYEKAVEAYRSAFTSAPDNPMLPLYAARLRYRMNDVPKAAANLEVALKKAKQLGRLSSLVKVVEANPLFSAMLTSDETLAALRRYDAKAKAPDVATIASASADGLSREGGVMRDSIRNAAPGLDRVATLRQQDKDVLDALSAANDELKFRRYREAINGYNDALSLNTRSGVLNPTQVAFIYEKVGTAYNKLGLAGNAIKALRACVQTAPMDTAAHYQLSLAYAVLGRTQDSVHALAEALKSAPNPGELRRYTLLAKTDPELEAVRDLPAFKATLDEHKPRVASR